MLFSDDTDALVAADRAHSWHPFTQMRAWCDPAHEPLVLVEGEGAILRDSRGREYLDGNSSIWTNLHGHNHPRLNAAIRAQLDRVAHISFLGSTNAPAARLAERLCALFPPRTLTRAFFSDNGSTAIEVALKMAVQFWQLDGRPERDRFIAFDRAYHGDTAGAASVGGIASFHGRFERMHFPVERIASVEELDAIAHPETLAAVVIEPLVQGAAGIRLWPAGMLRTLRAWCDAHGVFLILDEVLTGFGRTGAMFACEREGVIPDFLCLAKGLSGGYLPLAATLTTERVFERFLGETAEERTLYYGHSYTGNPLACAAALASLDIFRDDRTLDRLAPKIDRMRDLLAGLATHPRVREVRQCGFIAGIEIGADKETPYPWTELRGARVCEAARAHGLLTRPVLDTIVLMPPYCTTDEQLAQAVDAIRRGIDEVCR
ncbi:MAG: adenosylmethionine--8-amino-7-oxononanoate transaminase [Terrimicrobiaceae bacterium]|nr:adenosylmethionine--8-amino-7-oxononanoate transaminase [Terrimicrobiaceae bacterium]